MNTEINDVLIRFSGDSGDGMQLTGMLFSDTSALEGNNISTFPDFPSEIRAPQGTIAGVSGFQVHLSNRKVINASGYCDLLVAMNPAALKANFQWLKKDAMILCDVDAFTEKNLSKAGFESADPFAELGLQDYNIVLAPITTMNKEALVETGLDSKSMDKCKNMFALGVCYYLYDKPLEHTITYFQTKFAKKPEVAEANTLTLKAGYNYASNTHLFANTYTVPRVEKLEPGRYRTITGNQAIAWGFIAASEKSGRPLFCGSYPITPATSILEELAKRKDLGIKTLQAEDEIAGICTAIGAAWAGNFSVTTTSGPGLSLKSEALGLAVMTELPLVVVDVQRGGPSTGLPTKTEQSDLNQALWGRNGESPMVVMAATHPSDCFDRAFYASKIAMEHMTPVLLLSDSFIANGSQPWRIPKMSEYPEIEPPVINQPLGEHFAPFLRDAEKLCRKWAIPGTAQLEHRIGGLEKDYVNGSLSHNPLNHQKMVNIRAEKVARVAQSIPLQEVYGDESGELLVVGWGGTFGNLRTAVDQLRDEVKSISHCHFSFINPLPKNTLNLFKQYKKIIVCELNMGQFVGYLRSLFPEVPFQQFNKVQGLPFNTEELVDQFNALLG